MKRRVRFIQTTSTAERPNSDPAIDAVRRTSLGLFLGLLVGAAIGLLHWRIWKRLSRRTRYPLIGQPYTESAIEQEIQDEIDRRAGI